MPKLRNAGIRHVHKAIFIFCEGGKTEPLYFTELLKQLKFPLNLASVEIVQSKHTDLVGLVNDAKEHRNIKGCQSDEYWIVADKDRYEKHHQGFCTARANNIKIAFSSICFEYWLLLHFEYTTAPKHKCEILIAECLKKHCSRYKKNDASILSDFIPKRNNALQNAHRLRKFLKDSNKFDIERTPYKLSVYTDVDKLVMSITKYRDSLMESRSMPTK